MGARTAPAAPSIKTFERSWRFGPKAQPFFLAVLSDGSTKMLRGLNPIETEQFVQQHIDSGVTKEQAQTMVAAINAPGGTLA